MWFWVFMLVNNLIVPIVMIVFGQVFCKHPPGQINSVYGFRTKMSRLNQQTWEFAHQYFGHLWLRAGCGLLPVAVLGMLCVYGKSETVVGIGGAVVLTVQMVVMMLPVAQTERELRRRFTETGQPALRSGK